MVNNNQLNICRVCGYIFIDLKPWGEDGETASFAYCPCCFTEFGFDDVDIELIRKRRQEWIDKGGFWYEPGKKPKVWNLDSQLANIPKEFR